MEELGSFQGLALDLRPDVVKFWPQKDQYAVAGTYTLLEDEPSETEGPVSQQRVGSLNLIQVVDDKLTVIQTLPTPFGVYDLHFSSRQAFQDDYDNSTSFAVATSTGSVAIYRLIPSEEQEPTFPHPKISHMYTIQYFSKDILITSLAWYRHGLIAMTLSDGHVCLGRVDDPTVSPVLSVELMQHDFQAWTCAFVVSEDENMTRFGLISGGDDATLRYIPVTDDQTSALQLGNEITCPPAQTIPWADRKIHQAGVTAVLPIGSTPTGFLVITGSYDDHIRLLHIPDVGRREVLAEENLEGGVFRIKLAKEFEHNDAGSGENGRTYALIVSCMQAGARIVNLHRNGDKWYFDVRAKFEKNEGTLLYASDCQSAGPENKRVIVSTSFEDRKLYFWKACISP